MNSLLTSGAMFGFIFLFMVVEACVLIPYYRKTGAGVPPLSLLCALLAGGGLLLASGAVLLGAPAACIGLSLMLALVGHIADLKFKWRSATKRNVESGSTQKVNAAALAQSNSL